MSKKKELCSKDSLCEKCQKELEKTLAKHEDWEINLKKHIKENQMYTHHEGNSLIQYSITGGYSYISCPHGCGKMSIKKNDFGDETELGHECNKQSTLTERERERAKTTNLNLKYSN